VTEAGLTSNDLSVVGELDLSWSSDFSEAAETELTHLSLTPTEHFALVSHGQRVTVASSDVTHLHLVEEFDKGGHGGNLNSLGETKLTFKATAPRIQVTLISEHE
jgi:hypothetical protein